MTKPQKQEQGGPSTFKIKETEMKGRPILIDEDEHITHMAVAVLNYYQDAEHHMGKLEEVLKVVKRENEFFVKTNLEAMKELKELKALLHEKR